MKNQIQRQYCKVLIYSILIALILLNNIFSIFVFLAEEYIQDTQHEIIIDMLIVFFYLLEFIYNWATYPEPRN